MYLATIFLNYQKKVGFRKKIANREEQKSLHFGTLTGPPKSSGSPTGGSVEGTYISERRKREWEGKRWTSWRPHRSLCSWCGRPARRAGGREEWKNAPKQKSGRLFKSSHFLSQLDSHSSLQGTHAFPPCVPTWVEGVMPQFDLRENMNLLLPLLCHEKVLASLPDFPPGFPPRKPALLLRLFQIMLGDPFQELWDLAKAKCGPA